MQFSKTVPAVKIFESALLKDLSALFISLLKVTDSNGAVVNPSNSLVAGAATVSRAKI